MSICFFETDDVKTTLPRVTFERLGLEAGKTKIPANPAVMYGCCFFSHLYSVTPHLLLFHWLYNREPPVIVTRQPVATRDTELLLANRSGGRMDLTECECTK